MGRFKFDLVSAVKHQLGLDNDRKKREEAKLRADPAIAARISQYRQRYPHLTPGILLAAAKKGYEADDPFIDNIARLTANRKVARAQGWYSPGDDPVTKDDPRKWFQEVAADYKPRESIGVLDVFKPFTRATSAVGLSGAELIASGFRAGAAAIEDRDLSKLLSPFTDERYTAIEAAKGVLSGQGAGLGKGYFPHGPTTEKQSEAARDVYSLEYSDKPLFSQPGTPDPPVERHAGTTGRIVMKDVTQPGSFWFQAGSGAIDFLVATVFDPAAKIAKVAGKAQAAKKVFTAAEAGRTAAKVDDVADAATGLTARARAGTAKSATAPFTEANEITDLAGKPQSEIRAELSRRMGLIDGRRQTVHAPTFQNWLTTDKVGQQYVKAIADNPSAYDIWKSHLGDNPTFSPLLAREMADAKTPEEVVRVLSPQLGTGLALKPSVSSFTPVGGIYEGVGIKNAARSVRLLQTMPKGAVDAGDISESANQIVRYARNGKLSENQIEPLFDALTRAPDIRSRQHVFQLTEYAVGVHAAEMILNSAGSKANTSILNKNFASLRAAYRHDDEILNELNRMHASRGTVVRNVIINGELSNPLRGHYLELEERSQIYRFADPREVRRITSTYGRLLNNAHLDLPVALLDHINNLYKGTSILRPALAPRVHGEEHLRMAVAGYDTMLNNPVSYQAFLTGRKGASDIFGHDFNLMDELHTFRKALVKESQLHAEPSQYRQVIPFTDKNFIKAWAGDIQNLIEDPVMTRLAGKFDDADAQTGNFIEDAKVWLSGTSDEAVAYRAENSITADNLSSEVDRLHNDFISKTYNNSSIKDAVRTALYNNEPILQNTAHGPRFSKSFQAHLKSLNDADKAPELTIGDIRLPATAETAATAYRRSSDFLFSWLLTKPSNKFNRSLTYKQQYWKSATDELIIHAAPDTQKALIQAARDVNLGDDVIKRLIDKSANASGDLTMEEVDKFAQARGLEAVKSLFYEMSDRNQALDIMRLIWPFGEAWKEGMTAWAKLARDRPQIIPRALMVVDGARDSGFFYTDPLTGEEMFAWPGGHLATKAITGMPAPIESRVQSLNMITGGGNPLMPGFGVLAQQAARQILPNTPRWDAVRELISPYNTQDPSNPLNFLPSWAQHLRTYIDTSSNEKVFANTRADVMRYLYSTGKYDLKNSASMAQFEDRANQLARNLTLFRALAQATLPAAPSFQDVAEDKEGHTTLAFALTEDYRRFLEEDKDADTHLAVTKFIDKYGEYNLLYMQSATKGGEIFSKSAYDWVRENPDIARKYPDSYALFAPDDGGLDMRAYSALFENGQRKPLSPREFLSAAQNRVAKMAYRNAQDKLPDPSKRTRAQKEWLRGIKQQLINEYPGFVPEFQGNDIPQTIRQLQEAVDDPRLAKNPQAQAISEYLGAREKVIAIAVSKNIDPFTGWQTAKATRLQRDWLREVASDITSRYPSFKNINRELFDQELGDDD